MTKFNLAAALGAGLAFGGLAAPAFAGPDASGNYVANGGFELSQTATGISSTTSLQVGNTADSNHLTLDSWYMADKTTGAKLTTNPMGYTFLYKSDTGTSGTQADTVGANGEAGNVKLWGPGDGSANGLTNCNLSGCSKNFVSMDNNYQQAALAQSVTGLTVGTVYQLNFFWAAAQQYNFDGTTQEQFTVSFGNQSYATNTINLASHGFSGWNKVTTTFKATSTTQVLSFLATGTPGGAPPFSLLDGVSLTAVPEPGTWALLGAGVLGLAAFARHRRRGAAGGATAA